jgi:hypothetical protein
MNNLKRFRNNQKHSMVILPAEDYEELKESSKLTREIYNLLVGSSSQNAALKEYISEKEAKKLLGKGTTWFWNQRNSGKLAFKKLGATVYYKSSDILNLLNSDSDDE